MAKTKLVINRSGFCEAKRKSKNQCKDIGHTKYSYNIKVTVKDKLDEEGFVIDHQDIHNAVEKVFKGKMNSCEKLGLKIAESVEKAVENHGSILQEIHVMIKPIPETPDDKVSAFMEVVKEY